MRGRWDETNTIVVSWGVPTRHQVADGQTKLEAGVFVRVAQTSGAPCVHEESTRQATSHARRRLSFVQFLKEMTDEVTMLNLRKTCSIMPSALQRFEGHVGDSEGYKPDTHRQGYANQTTVKRGRSRTSGRMRVCSMQVPMASARTTFLGREMISGAICTTQASRTLRVN